MADYSVKAILDLVSQRQRINLGDLYALVEKQGLGAYDLEINASGIPRWKHNIRGNLQLLKKKGMLLNPEKGVWQLPEIKTPETQDP